MKTLVLDVTEQKKKAFGQLLRELKRLDIRVLSIDGKAVTDMEELTRIAESPTESTGKQVPLSAQQRTTNVVQTGARSSHPAPKPAKAGKRKVKTAQTTSWQFSDHIFPGVETKTFSRQEIYEDAEWEKNLH